jgi:hypothetical protein
VVLCSVNGPPKSRNCMATNDLRCVDAKTQTQGNQVGSFTDKHCRSDAPGCEHDYWFFCLAHLRTSSNEGKAAAHSCADGYGRLRVKQCDDEWVEGEQFDKTSDFM